MPNHQQQHQQRKDAGPVVAEPELVPLDDGRREAAVAALAELLSETLPRHTRHEGDRSVGGG